VISLLGMIALFFLVRKISRSKRVSRRRRWFRGSAAFNAAGENAENRISHRSSFGTTVDHGAFRPLSTDLFVTSEPFNLSWPRSSAASPDDGAQPEMMQNVGARISVTITEPPPATTAHHSISPIIRRSEDSLSDGRQSPEGAERSTSQLSQYLEIPDSAAALMDASFPSPISVRPFSPNERWSFPKPPNDELKRQSQAILSLQRSTLTSTVRDSGTAQTTDTHILDTPPTPQSSNFTLTAVTDAASDYLPGDDYTKDPFADNVSVFSQTVDTHVSTDSDNAEHFAPVETIRRPFTPTLADELEVKINDDVRIIRRFDDGWVYAEKVDGGKKGLFPLDCLRDKGEDLPTFLAKKRLSSWMEGGSESFRASVVGTAF